MDCHTTRSRSAIASARFGTRRGRIFGFYRKAFRTPASPAPPAWLGAWEDRAKSHDRSRLRLPPACINLAGADD
jgi:hypothetical protein